MSRPDTSSSVILATSLASISPSSLRITSRTAASKFGSANEMAVSAGTSACKASPPKTVDGKKNSTIAMIMNAYKVFFMVLFSF
jgi:hypothetical protein